MRRLMYPMSLLFGSMELGLALNCETIKDIAGQEVPFKRAYALTHLQRAGLLTPRTMAILKDRELWYEIAFALIDLQEGQIYTPGNEAAIVVSLIPGSLSHALVDVQSAGIMNATREALVASPNPFYLARGLIKLHEGQIQLTPELMAVVSAHPLPEFLAQKMLASQAVQECVTAATLPNRTAELVDLAFAFKLLRENTILTGENVAALAVARHPCFAAQGLVVLNQAGLLIDARRDLIVAHHDPLRAAYLLVELHQQDELTAQNEDFVKNCEYQNISELINARALGAINTAGEALCLLLYDNMRSILEDGYAYPPHKEKLLKLLLDAIWNHVVRNRSLPAQLTKLFVEYSGLVGKKCEGLSLGLQKQLIKPTHCVAKMLQGQGVISYFSSEFYRIQNLVRTDEFARLQFLKAVTRPEKSTLGERIQGSGLFERRLLPEIFDFVRDRPDERERRSYSC